MPSGSFDVGLDRLQITALVKNLAVAEPAMRKELPKRLRKAVAPIVAAAKDNAAQVSPGKPIKIGTRVRLVGRNGASIKILATSPSDGPLAGLLERGAKGSKGNSGSFRHPVYGNRNVWVDQPTQPYLQPALDAHQDEAIAGTSEVITDVLAAMKFR